MELAASCFNSLHVVLDCCPGGLGVDRSQVSEALVLFLCSFAGEHASSESPESPYGSGRFEKSP